MDMPSCEFSNGTMRGRDGTRHAIACDKPAVRNIDGWWFCATHAGMVERGSLEHFYSDGRTLRGAMEQAALHRLIERANGQLWQGSSRGTC